MKRLYTFAVWLIAAFALCGCANISSYLRNESTETATEESSENKYAIEPPNIISFSKDDDSEESAATTTIEDAVDEEQTTEATKEKVALSISGELLDYTFYRDQLSLMECQIYDAIVSGCNAFESRIDLPSGVTKDEFYVAVCAVQRDHPEFFWVESEFSMKSDYSMVEFNMPEDASDISSTLFDAAKSILANASGSDYDVVKYIYEWIIDNTSYSTNAANNQDIRSVLLNGQSVCAGYSRTFQYLCLLAGIKCTYVTGVGENVDHGWNLVYIDAKCYWVDVTFGDPNYTSGITELDSTYDYLCLTDDLLFANHTLDTGVSFVEYTATNVFTYPSCTDMSLYYYVLNGNYFEEYTREAVYSYIGGLFAAGQYESICLKFANADSYSECIDDLLTGEKYIATIAYELLGWRSAAWSYSYSESKHMISIDLWQQ